MRSRNVNALLVEIMIAVLIFSLCATVILQGFTAARVESDRAELLIEAQLEAQNLADRLYLCDSDEAVGQLLGSAEADGLWRLPQESGCVLTVSVAKEAAGAGTLRRCELRAMDGDSCLLTLSCDRYLSGEVGE